MPVPGAVPPKLLIDINIVLDLVLARAPWHRDAAILLDLIEKGRADGYLAAHTITTIHFIVRKSKGAAAASQKVVDILKIAELVPLGNDDIQQALALGFSDIEDAVQAAAALRIGADWVVTRNERDFKRSGIPAISAAEAITRI